MTDPEVLRFVKFFNTPWNGYENNKSKPTKNNGEIKLFLFGGFITIVPLSLLHAQSKPQYYEIPYISLKEIKCNTIKF